MVDSVIPFLYMLFLYCVGAIVMPAVGSTLMGWFGPSALFVQNALVHVLLAGFIVWRIFVRDVQPFTTTPRLTARAGLG